VSKHNSVRVLSVGHVLTKLCCNETYRQVEVYNDITCQKVSLIFDIPHLYIGSVRPVASDILSLDPLQPEYLSQHRD
jgi:hypothetical protein